MAEATSIQGKTVIVQNAMCFRAGTTETANQGPSSGTPDATGTVLMSTTVPWDGAELVACRFTVTSAGSVTTSGTQALAISDGTNTLASVAATDATSAAGTVVTLTPASVANGKAIATTTGARLILTNTEVGTIGDGMHGVFTLVWAL